jgi:hypothetical protein
LSFESFQVLLSRFREVPEWLKGPAWKAGIGATLSRVRIPSSLQIKESLRLVSGFFMRISQNRFLLSDNLTEINLTQSDLVHPFDLPSTFFQNVY